MFCDELNLLWDQPISSVKLSSTSGTHECSNLTLIVSLHPPVPFSAPVDGISKKDVKGIEPISSLKRSKSSALDLKHYIGA